MAQKKNNKSSKKKSQDTAAEDAKKKRKPGELSTFQKTVIIIFVVVFALSTLAGALASVFQSQNSTTQTLTAADIDASYEGTVSDLEAKVKANPEDTESLLALAQNCSSWGTTLSWFSSTDEDAATRSTELIERAITYYDQYLALEDSADARLGKAQCESYLGDTASAMTELGELTKAYPDYANGWVALGSLYESQGMTDEAAAAYQSAIDADSDGEQGVKDTAQQHLDALQSAGEESTDDGSADATDESADTDADADAEKTDSQETSE